MTIQRCLEMAAKSLHTLVIILLVSQLIFSKASSASRTGVNLLYNSQDTPSSDHNAQLQKITKRGAGRANLEFNDYSNTGANGRHTPEPPTLLGGNN
ncbi:hypothetical protein OIU76_013511 [Salix suchowensis]|uniref:TRANSMEMBRANE PROTEIN n=2 Tax=Salix TaxID=40685 RepID=A0A9Q0WJR6_9ROSI|nr:hypothetical protein IMY05_008G0073000 [Salix suchowensis]KAJ6317974.1 hypothetical protein OIU76_013511 [Salix suchowensis]KAJ6322431.1 hypothetical protein OIU77_012305 [Salix suchowensis]KAJ6350559.1 hypothetical protein OIU78_006675 [Salix suchowensis]KAJ6768322.1 TRANSMEMBRANE PROTEIN [Salix koriyanagi]